MIYNLKDYGDAITNLELSTYKINVLDRLIPANSNLNNYLDCGNWAAKGTGVAATIVNSPTAIAFKLICEYINSEDYLVQTVVNRQSEKWVRSYDFNTGEWSKWILHTLKGVKGININSSNQLVLTTTEGKTLTFTPTSVSG